MKRTLQVLLSLFVLASMVLAACAPAAETPTEEAPASSEASSEAPASSEAMPAFEGKVLDAGSCENTGIIKSVEAVDQYTVTFTLCQADPAFLSKIAFSPFGIYPEEWLEATLGEGTRSSEGLERPIGTGPYMVDEWRRGESVNFVAYEGYWGEQPEAPALILRWQSEAAARLLELQAGTVDGIDNVGPTDFEVVAADSSLQLVERPALNIFYIGMTNTFAPYDDVRVRQAIAMGIDRQRIVDSFYPAGSEVASHFTPCSIPNGCAGESWYDLDVQAANDLLDAAGFPRNEDGIRFSTTVYYRDVFRGYLPEPGLVAVEIANQLRDNLGIDAAVVVMESGEFIAESTAGRLDGLYLLGWGADYPHVTNFLDYHFTSGNPQFGTPHAEIYGPLEEASRIADTATAAPLYEAANNAIKALIPMIPVAHGASADAALATVSGAYVPPFGATQFYYLDPGKDTLVFVQNAEPISLYCGDESDGESLRPCQQAVETLLEYGQDSGDTSGELATACTSNADLTVWTCTLRDGVTFHDGSAFDANDVVASWAAGIDAANPNHVGNTGTFTYFAYLWDGFINAPAE